MVRIVDTDGSIYYGKDLLSINSFLFHREDGPAIEYADGRIEYWVEGKLHREDGPAIVYPGVDNGYCWFLNGELMTYEEFIKVTPISEEAKLIIYLAY